MGNVGIVFDEGGHAGKDPFDQLGRLLTRARG